MITSPVPATLSRHAQNPTCPRELLFDAGRLPGLLLAGVLAGQSQVDHANVDLDDLEAGR
ncbi:MAG: hypothetical protein V7646_5776, partial [Pseudonocardia sp.]